jgi:hypothetical protein
MIVFQQGRSYMWLFFAFVAFFLGGNALCYAYGHQRWGSALLPAIVALVTVGEFFSGVALDSWWRASYPRGTENYWLALVLQTLFVAASMVFVLI